MNSDQFSNSSNPSYRSPQSGSQQSSSGVGAQSGSRQQSGGTQDLRTMAGEAASKLGEVAQQAGSRVKEAASSLATEANQQAKGFLNQQVSAGADMAGHFADSVKRAADELDKNAPQLAGLVRDAAGRMENFSRDLRGQSVEELMQAAANFTRRQPAVVFGLAALAGFALFRVLKAHQPNGSPTTHREFGEPYRGTGYRPGERYGQQAGERYGQQSGQFHGV